MGGSTSGKADAILLSFVSVRDVLRVVGWGGIIIGLNNPHFVLPLAFVLVPMIIVYCESPSFLKTGEMYEIFLMFPPLYLLVK